jgi:hypothetical protein
MPPRPRNIIPFPARRDNRRITLSDADHALLTDLISPYYSSDVADLLARAAPSANGRTRDPNHPHLDDLLAAIACEVHGYMKLDEEREGRPRHTPKPGSTAERCLAIYRHIDNQLS